MSRSRDAGLAASFLALAVLFGTLQRASLDHAWVIAGAIATVVAEALAHRRPALVREQFERRSVLAATAAVVGAAIGIGGVLAPDRTLSLAIGGFGAYLLLLGAASAAETHAGDTR